MVRTTRTLIGLGACGLTALAMSIGTGSTAAAEPRGLDGCDMNYTGDCVPIASDVDCADGEGDGPEYVEGPVQVVGQDIYDLDRDGSGIGCPNGDGSGAGGNGGGNGGGGTGGGNGGGTGGGGGGAEPPLAVAGGPTEILVGGATLTLLAGVLTRLAARRRTA